RTVVPRRQRVGLRPCRAAGQQQTPCRNTTEERPPSHAPLPGPYLNTNAGCLRPSQRVVRLGRMPSRRAFLGASLASLLPRQGGGQSRSLMDGLLTSLAARHRVPAAGAALIHGGETVDLSSVGAQPWSLFQAASISKVVTAVVVLRLVHRGRIA